MNYQTYIVTNRFKGKGICGQVNLPYGTPCSVEDGFIISPKGIICAVTSQNAYDFFAQNDDNNGLVRGKLTANIIKRLRNNSQMWAAIEKDMLCKKYRREDIEDAWIWSYDFYSAEITGLLYIAKLIGAKEK